MDIEELIKCVNECCWEVHRVFEAGYLESVYKKALAYELSLHGLKVQQEVEIRVEYKGLEVGFFRADLIVDDRLVIELKAVSELTKSHGLQLVNYLASTGIDDGLLVNFGGEKLEIKRKYRIYTPTNKSKR